MSEPRRTPRIQDQRHAVADGFGDFGQHVERGIAALSMLRPPWFDTTITVDAIA